MTLGFQIDLINCRKLRMLVATGSVQLRRRMEQENAAGELELGFAATSYECGTAVERLRPDRAIIDAALGPSRWLELTQHLRQDPRIPAVEIIVIDPDRSCLAEPTEPMDGVRFVPTWSLAAIRRLVSLARGEDREGSSPKAEGDPTPARG